MGTATWSKVAPGAEAIPGAPRQQVAPRLGCSTSSSWEISSSTSKGSKASAGRWLRVTTVSPAPGRGPHSPGRTQLPRAHPPDWMSSITGLTLKHSSVFRDLKVGLRAGRRSYRSRGSEWPQSLSISAAETPGGSLCLPAGSPHFSSPLRSVRYLRPFPKTSVLGPVFQNWILLVANKKTNRQPTLINKDRL